MEGWGYGGQGVQQKQALKVGVDGKGCPVKVQCVDVSAGGHASQETLPLARW